MLKSGVFPSIAKLSSNSSYFEGIADDKSLLSLRYREYLEKVCYIPVSQPIHSPIFFLHGDAISLSDSVKLIPIAQLESGPAVHIESFVNNLVEHRVANNESFLKTISYKYLIEQALIRQEISYAQSIHHFGESYLLKCNFMQTLTIFPTPYKPRNQLFNYYSL